MEEVDLSLKASFFAAIIALLFIASTATGVLMIYNGYGIPSRFRAVYWLDSYTLLISTGKQAGKPVVYEWIIATVLKPGITNVSIVLRELGALERALDYATIQFYFDDKIYEANSSSLSVTVERNTVFFIGKARVIFSPDASPTIKTPVVYVDITTTDRMQ
jgi:hypothetical protein